MPYLNKMVNEISAAIAKITREPVDINHLKSSNALVADLGLNSINRMRLILELEKTLNIEIDLQQIDVTVFNSLEQLEKYIQNNSRLSSDNN
jgi:acyl carrier protein